MVHMRTETSDDLSYHWGAGLVSGLALALLGLLLAGYATFSTSVAVTTLGLILVVAAIIQTAHALALHRSWGLVSGLFLSAGFYLVLGLAMMSRPDLDAWTLTALVAAFFVALGLSRTLIGLLLQFRGWAFTFLSGVFTLGLGLVLWIEWPTAPVWLLGLSIAIELVAYGASWVGVSLRAHRSGGRVS